MDKLIAGSIIAAASAAVFCLLPILTVLVGAFSGWVVGWFFDETILGILSQIGISDVAMWQVGAFLGFVGGFLKTSVSTSK